jgi:indole-3-glycerol phosphate synthase
MFIDDAMRQAADSARERMLSVPAGSIELAVEAAPPAADFRRALTRGGGPVRMIAEFKRSSPSAGEISLGASVAGLVEEYERGGASAVSILTSELFDGSLSDLAEARVVSELPLLRKEFVSLEYQVLETRAFGASAVLLISDALAAKRLVALVRFANELGLEPLVETHGRAGLENAIEAGADVIGMNNRDLRTLEVDLGTTERLMAVMPPGVVTVGESGIRTREDVLRMQELGVDALLVGEELMRAADPASRLRELLGCDPMTGAACSGVRENEV